MKFRLAFAASSSSSSSAISSSSSSFITKTTALPKNLPRHQCAISRFISPPSQFRERHYSSLSSLTSPFTLSYLPLSSSSSSSSSSSFSATSASSSPFFTLPNVPSMRSTSTLSSMATNTLSVIRTMPSSASLSSDSTHASFFRKMTASRHCGISYRHRHEGTELRRHNGVYQMDDDGQYRLVFMVDRKDVNVEKDAKKIVRSAINSADMTGNIQEKLKVVDESGVEGVVIEVDEQRYHLNKNVYMVAYGKGVLHILERAVEESPLREHLVKGIAVIPDGLIKECFKGEDKPSADFPPGVSAKTLAGKLDIFGAAKKNLPDEKTMVVSQMIIDMCRQLKKDDILLVVCTGGGSNLFQLPLDEDHVEQQTINELISQMQQKGADREEINMMRRHLSAVKGGRFAIMMQPTKILTLIISDVVGDKMETIASGPTFPEMTSPVMCLDLLTNFQIEIEDVRQYFEKRSLEEERLRQESQSCRSYLPAHRDRNQFTHVQNILLANNQKLIQGAVAAAEELGYRALQLSNQEFGLVIEKAHLYAKLFPFMCRLLRRKLEQPDKFLAFTEMELMDLGLDKAKAKEIAVRANVAVNTNSGLCVVVGGEFTCSHQPGGVGGVYLEMALHVARELHKQKDNKANMTEEFECVFLAFDTDGIDGNSTAAGAWVNADVIKQAKASGLSAIKSLESSDSFKFFNALDGGKYLITTGHISLDLMGLVLLLVRPKNLDQSFQS